MKTLVKLMTVCARATAITLILCILMAIITGDMSNLALSGCVFALLLSAASFLVISCYIGIVYWLKNRDNP